MTVSEIPYFLTNEKWYFYDEEDFCYKLTKEAPEEAKESYNEFYGLIKESDKIF